MDNCHLGVFNGADERVLIGEECVLKYAELGVHGSHGKIEIRDRVTINAKMGAITSFKCSADRFISVQPMCLLSNGIRVSTEDSHQILDQDGHRMNHDKDVVFGEHVWVGERVYICKGVSIPDNSVVAACSVLTKTYTDPNVMIAGNPAIIKRRAIQWIR